MRLPSLAVCAAGILAATARAQAPDFTVDFDGPSRPIPPGLLYGMNELANASRGVWQAWTESVGAHDGLIRVWLKYHEGKLNETHFRTCERAREFGFGILITISGQPGLRVDKRADGVLQEPPLELYVEQALRDVRTLLDRGYPIRHVEIWNEPDMPDQWGGSAESFARFFAAAGQRLRAALPPEVKVGGPGMAASSGGGLRHFRGILSACRDLGWHPDFLSWHDYSGLPMDQFHHNTARRLTEMTREFGLRQPELILSEWNQGLPGRNGKYPALDDHRNAATFVSMTTALAYTDVTHCQFFYLQDGVWDTTEDYGERGGVGLFTVRGGPKSVLAGMRMMATACALPRVPVAPREGLPVCFSLLATREGARGYLVAASVTEGKVEQHAKRLVERAGIDLTSIADKDVLIQRYSRGDVSYEQTGLPAKDRAAWERIVAAMRAFNFEQRQKERSIVVRLRGQPARIAGAWVIDATHANPVADADLRRRFKPFEQGIPIAALQMTVQQLRGEGVPEDQIRMIEDAFRAKRESALERLPRETATRARTLFAEMTERIENEVPRELARHPSAAPAAVEWKDWARMEGDLLTLRLPPYTSLMLELAWDAPATDGR